MRSVGSNCIFRVSRWFGVLPYNEEGKMTKFLKIRSLVTFFLTSLPTVVIRTFQFYDSRKRVLTEQAATLLSIFLTAVVLCAMLAHVVQSLRNKHRFEDILSLKTPQTELSDKIVLVFGIICHVQCLSQALIGFFGSNENSVLYSDRFLKLALMMSCVGNFYLFLVILQFSCLIGGICSKMNDIARNRPIKNRDFDRHWKMVKTAQSLSSLYGIQVFLAFIPLGGYIVVTVYSNIAYFVTYKTLSFQYFLATAALTVTRMVTIWVAVDRPNRFNQSAEAFNNELFKLMRSNKELCRDSKLFLYVTMRQTVRFSACGFFNLGYPLVTSIIAAATTYLVILLQFSME